MKRIAKIAIISLMAVMCMNAACFAQEKVDVYDEEQLLEVFRHGGYAVLQDHVSFDYDETIWMYHDVAVDLNGYNIIIYGDDYEISSNVCFMNGRVNLFGDSIYINSGTMAVKKGLLNLSELNNVMKADSYLLEADSDAHITISSEQRKIPVSRLYVDSEYITDEILIKMAKTGELPELTREGYTFNGWKDRGEKSVKTWRGSSVSDHIHASWSENTASIFGGGNIWMVLTFIFFLSTVVLAVLYMKKNRTGSC